MPAAVTGLLVLVAVAGCTPRGGLASPASSSPSTSVAATAPVSPTSGARSVPPTSGARSVAPAPTRGTGADPQAVAALERALADLDATLHQLDGQLAGDAGVR